MLYPEHIHASKRKHTKIPDFVAPVSKEITEDQIIAVINGQILTKRDVDDRARLFVLSTGLPIDNIVLNRMRGQILHQMIEEKLKNQEILRRHININPDQISAAITNIEARNGMPENSLRNKLKQENISLTTLIDQIRAQIGWMQVLRMELGPRNRVTSQQIIQREKAFKNQYGRPQYFMSEIFIPARDPLHAKKELIFTETIIKQLRDGAPFPIVAAQFSHDPSALEGGSLGWIEEDRLDPEVVNVIREMPDQAISNPIKVPAGYVIATVHERRKVGLQIGTIISIRQAFFPFEQPLDTQNPTDNQKLILQESTDISKKLKNCDEMEALNRRLKDVHPSNPGLQIEERLSPQLAQLLKPLPLNVSTHPLVSPEGISLLMICSRTKRNLAEQTPGQIADQLMNERIEQNAQQLQRTLERSAVIQIRPAGRALLSHE